MIIICFNPSPAILYTHTQTRRANISKYWIENPIGTKNMRKLIEKDDQAESGPQPRRLSIRRPSFKREVIENESFIDIQLKPVVKGSKEAQNAEESEGHLTKVNSTAHTKHKHDYTNTSFALGDASDRKHSCTDEHRNYLSLRVEHTLPPYTYYTLLFYH